MDHSKMDLLNDCGALIDLLEGVFSHNIDLVLSPSEQAGVVIVLQQVREKERAVMSLINGG